jgi:tetratricopeptide (TPR) repeat protein
MAGRQDDASTFLPIEEARTVRPGTVLADRYQIVNVLGIGGMGAVYTAFDRQLTRTVALKTILPELAVTPTALNRLKQEVVLAQSVVHRNVIRIFDIGQDGPTKFITMDFIEGRTLKQVIDNRGTLPVDEAVGIIRQVCDGLEAAHSVGVVHRDLKPQNIMLKEDGHIVVMDFGIAHSGQSPGLTMTGAFLGTPDYMSPEQAKGEDVDARSDIFSVGLIFYELLTGSLPFQGKTILETIFKRTTERAVPPGDVDQRVPKAVSDIVAKCLENDREKRYESTAELLQTLASFDPTRKVGVATRARALLRKGSRYSKMGLGVVAAGVVATALWGYVVSRADPRRPAVAHAPVTVVIADFSNDTGDAVLENSLEPVVRMALERAAFITAYDRSVIRNLGIPAIDGRFDEQAARQVAVAQGVAVVVSGSVQRRGRGYAVSLKATQAVTGNTIRAAEAIASTKKEIVSAATTLSAGLQTAMGADTSESAQRFAMDTLTTTSLEAVHEYAVAREAMAGGRFEEALKRFAKAVEIDRDFGAAYPGMAIAAGALGQQQDAEKYIQLAQRHLDNMTERERYRTRSSYYLLLGNHEKCVEEYTALLTRFPSDATSHNNLALCLTQLRQWPRALQEIRQAETILPKSTIYRNNAALYASYGSDFATGERDARAVHEMDPKFHLGYVSLAFAQVGQGRLAEAAETYRQQQRVSTLAGSYAAAGLADLALYEGRYEEAVRILQQGAAGDLAANYSDRAAAKFAMVAYVRLLQRHNAEAVSEGQKALDTSKVRHIRFWVARIFAAASRPDRAATLAAELGRELANEPRAYAKLIDGEIALAASDGPRAVGFIKEANALLDTWIGHFDLGRAYLQAAAFTEADSEFDVCIRRRGEALSMFLDEVPTYGVFPPVYYYLGRVREGLKSERFAENYLLYLSIREKAGEDPLIAEIRKRVRS